MDTLRRKFTQYWRVLPLIATCVVMLVLKGCSTLPTAPQALAPIEVGQAEEVDHQGEDTILLVSLADGSIVQQRIRVDADICMKANDSALTTCLKRGDPIKDMRGQAVIGYKMYRSDIELFGK